MQSEICNNCIEFHGSGRMDILHITPICDKFQTYEKNEGLEAALQEGCTELRQRHFFFLIFLLKNGQTVLNKSL